MADLGAEVIKVEPPGGDHTRSFQHQRDGRSGYFIQQNAGKRDIALDLRTAEGKAVLDDLVSIGDIVVENFRPGVMANLGFAYEDLRRLNPSVILCSISAFGQYGPYSERRGGDYNIQALSGMMWINGDPDGPPTWTGNAYCDTTTGLHAYGATVSALYNRLLTGRGEHIDVALMDCAIWQQEITFQQYLLSDGAIEPTRSGSARTDNAPANVYRGRDGFMVLAAMSDSAWTLLTNTMGMLDLEHDQRFATRMDRVDNQRELDRVIEGWVSSFDSIQDVIELLLSKGLVCGKVRDIPEIVADPNTAAREMLVGIDDPVIEGPVRVMNSPMRFHASTAHARGPAPLLGQDWDDVVCGLLGRSRDDALALIGNGAALVEDRALRPMLARLEADAGPS